MKKEATIITTTTYDRRGDSLHIRDVSGTIKIMSQKLISRGPKDTVQIEVTGTSDAHDHLQVRSSKGQICITGQNAVLPVTADLHIYVPSGISVDLENVGGSVSIAETIEVLTVVDDRPCHIFTDLLHGAMLRIGGEVDLKIRNLIGPCDIVAYEKAQVEVREAHATTLSAIVLSDAQVKLNGAARFADLTLKSNACCRIDTIEVLIGHNKEKTATLQLGRISLPDESKLKKKEKTAEDLRREAVRYEQIRQARKEMAQFSANFTPRNFALPIAVPT